MYLGESCFRSFENSSGIWFGVCMANRLGRHGMNHAQPVALAVKSLALPDPIMTPYEIWQDADATGFDRRCSGGAIVGNFCRALTAACNKQHSYSYYSVCYSLNHGNLVEYMAIKTESIGLLQIDFFMKVWQPHSVDCNNSVEKIALCNIKQVGWKVNGLCV